MDFYTILGLSIIALASYGLVLLIPEKKVKNRLSQVIQEKERPSFIKSLVQRLGIYSFLSPNELREKASKFGWNMSAPRYWASFVVSAALVGVVAGVYFSSIPITIVGAAIGGIILPNVEVHRFKKKYRTKIQSALGVYLQSVSSNIHSFDNAAEAIEEAIQHIDSPVRQDLEASLLRLKDGESVEQAFRYFVLKYSYNEVKLFHDVLDVVQDVGSDRDGQLRAIAQKFHKKRYYQRKISTAVNQYKRSFRTLSIMIMTTPFMFMVVTYDNYKVFTNHVAGNIAIILSLLIIGLVYIQMEKLSTYDPTEDRDRLSL